MRISLCIAEDDLRTWIMEELLLMTWVADQPSFDLTTDPTAVTPDCELLIADRLATAPTVPTIVIGADPGIPGVHVLTPGLTSRELKHAIRAALPRTPQTVHA